MPLFQPTNIIPSTFSGLANSVVDVTDKISVSWQVNGNEPMTGFTITIYKNDTASTQVDSPVTVNLSTPVYPTDAKGNPTIYTWSPGADWNVVFSSMTNGKSYKFKITQKWGSNQSTEQYSASVFNTRAKPTLDLSIDGQLSNYEITKINETVLGTFAQTDGDTINWVRWQLYEVISSGNPLTTEKEILIEDTGEVYTGLLAYSYDGFLPGDEISGKTISYKVVCMVESSSGTIVTKEETYGSYNKPSTDFVNNINLTCNKKDGSIGLTWGAGVLIPGTASESGVALSGGRLDLSGGSVTWDEVNGDDMSFPTPYSVALKGSLKTNVSFVQQSSNVQKSLSLTVTPTTTTESATLSGAWAATFSNQGVTIDNSTWVGIAFGEVEVEPPVNGYILLSETGHCSVVPDPTDYGSAYGLDIENNYNIEFNAIKYIGGKFFALGSNGYFAVLDITEGEWTVYRPWQTNFPCIGAAYVSGKYLVGTTNAFAWSSDGVTWGLPNLDNYRTQEGGASVEFWAYDIVAFGSKFYALSYDEYGYDPIVYSVDAFSSLGLWTNEDIPLIGLSQSCDFKFVPKGSKLWLFVSPNADANSASFVFNGTQWAGAPGVYASNVTTNDISFIDVSATGTVRYSDNGIEWVDTGIELLSSVTWVGIAYGDFGFLSISNGSSAQGALIDAYWGITATATKSGYWLSRVTNNSGIQSLSFEILSQSSPTSAAVIHIYTKVQADIPPTQEVAVTLTWKSATANGSLTNIAFDEGTATSITTLTITPTDISTSASWSIATGGQSYSVIVSNVPVAKAQVSVLVTITYQIAYSYTVYYTTYSAGDLLLVCDIYNGATLPYIKATIAALTTAIPQYELRVVVNLSEIILRITLPVDWSVDSVRPLPYEVVFNVQGADSYIAMRIKDPAMGTTPVLAAVNYNLSSAPAMKTLQVKGQQYVNWVFATKDQLTNTYLTPTWDNNTLLYAPFTSTYNAGTIDAEANILGYDIYRFRGEEEFRKVFSLAGGTTVGLKDFGVCVGEEYIYRLYARVDDKYLAVKDSETIKICLTAFYLYEAVEDENFPNVFHTVKAWRFGSNMSGGSYSNNNNPAWQQNFTPYPMKQFTAQKYISGTLSALLSNVNGNVYADTAEQMKALFDISKSENTFFLKDTKGNLYMVGIGSAITQTIETKTREKQVTVSIPWKEVGDASNVYLVATPSDPAYND